MSKQSKIFLFVSLNSSVILLTDQQVAVFSSVRHAASETLAADPKSATVDGVQALKQFLEELVYSKEKSLYDRVARNICLKGKTEQMETNALASVLHLVEQDGFLKFELCPNCLWVLGRFHIRFLIRESVCKCILLDKNLTIALKLIIAAAKTSFWHSGHK